MITFKFLTREAKGNAVFLRVTNNRRSLEISLGISLSSSDLDDALSDNPTVRNMEYNKFFTDIRKKADAVKLRLMADGRMNEDVAVIRDMVYKAVFGIEAKSRAKTFVEFFWP